MPFGVVALLAVAILVYFGVLHRVLDRMRLDDRTALLILLLMIVGSFFNLTVLRRPPLIINLGGAVVPVGVAVYLLATADTAREKLRGALAALVAGAVIYLGFKFLNPEEQTMIIEPTYFFAVVAGVVGYLAGRSRRASFVAGTMGVVIADIAHYVEVVTTGVRGQTWIGGAGAFDSVVIAGLLAVILAEVVGETREFMARGPLRSERRGRGRGDTGREMGEGHARGEAGGGEGGRFTATLGPAEPARGEKDRPPTSGGAGWEPPILDQAGSLPGGAAREQPRRDEDAPAATVTEPGDSPAPGPAGVDLAPMDTDEEERGREDFRRRERGRTGRAGRTGKAGRSGDGGGREGGGTGE